MLYKAFISYSHSADAQLAPALQSALERFAKPWYRIRAFRVFRDTTNLALAPELWPEIEKALGESEYLLFLASPAACKSKWVKRELTFWRERKDPSKQLIILTAGEIVWEDAAVDFDWKRSTAVPDVLRGAFAQEPLYLDFRQLRGSQHSLDNKDFLDHIATIAAPLHGKDKDEIFGEHIRQHRKAMRLAWSGVIALTVLVGVTSLLALLSYRRGNALKRELRTETAQRLAAEAERSSLEGFPQRGLLLAVEALQISLREGEPRLPAAEQSLRQVLAKVGGRVLAGHDDLITAALLSTDKRWLVTGSLDQTARMWDLTAKDPVATSIVFRHGDAVTAVALSSDNRWLVTGGADTTVRLWDLTSKEPAATPLVLLGHKGTVFAMVLSSDNRWLATGSTDKTARLWDLTAKNPAATFHVLAGHEGTICATAMSPNNQWLVTASLDGTARLWKLTAKDPAATPRVLKPTAAPHPLRDRKGSAGILAISPDSHWLATGSDDGAARLWDLTTLDPTEKPHVLQGHRAAIHAVAISPNNHWLVTGSLDGTARLWDLTAKDPSESPQILRGHEGPIYAVAISPDSRWLATGGEDKTARLWDLTADDRAAEPVVFRGHESPVSTLTIGNRWLITSSEEKTFHSEVSEDKTARLWDLNANSPAAASVILRGHAAQILSMALSSDNRWLITGSADETARLWDLTADDPVEKPRIFSHNGWVSGVAISADTRWLAIRSWLEGAVRLWDLTNLAAKPRKLGDELSVTAMAFRPDSRWLVTGSYDGTVRVWDLTARDPAAEPHILRGHNGPIWAIAITADSQRLVTGSQDGTARLWDLTAEDPTEKTQVMRGHEGPIYAAAVSPDGRWLATGSEDKTVSLWDLTANDPTAKPHILRGHDGTIWTIAISPDNRWLVTGSEDRTARLWDLTARKPTVARHIFHGHEARVSALAFSPDSRRLVTGSTDKTWSSEGVSADKTARLWDLNDPAAAPIILRHEAAVSAVAVSSDNRRVVTASWDSTVRLWHLQLDDLIELARVTAGRNLTRKEWGLYFPGQAYRKTFAELGEPDEPD